MMYERTTVYYAVLNPRSLDFHVGMISKSTGQILRVSAVMHALFNLEGEELGNTITPAAIQAAIHFVEVCCQQTAYIVGRGELDKELSMVVQGMCMR